MSEVDDIPKIPGYVSVKEAAEMLKVSDKMVYFYVENKRLGAVRASNLLLIPIAEIEKFEQKSVGRPRTKTPTWRKSSKDNALFMTSIRVQVYADKRGGLSERLDEIRRIGSYDFPGTIARYIIEYETPSEGIEILLIWKMGTAMDEDSRETAFNQFRQKLSDILDWNTAQYEHGDILLHT